MRQIRSRAPRKIRPAKWQDLKKGVQALKLWKSTGPKLPHVAILLLPSSEQYEAFLKNPKGYVNGLKIFPGKGTRKVIGCHLARKKAGTLYAVILKHEWDCTSIAISSSSVTL
jgi:hypothetical protein